MVSDLHTGPIATAEFVEPENIVVNKKGEILFTDQRINRVIKIAGGRVSTLVGGNIIDLVRRISAAAITGRISRR